MKKQLLAVLATAAFGTFAANEPLSAPAPSAIKYYLPGCEPNDQPPRAFCITPPIRLPAPPGMSPGLWEAIQGM